MLLHHELRGDGPNRTVLLHGFLGSGRNLSVIPRRWKDPERAFALLDLTGHGRSAAAGELSLEGMAEDVLQTLDALGWDRVRLVGHSLGGRVGLVMRGLQPDRIEMLDLLDITPGPIATTDADRVLEALLAAPPHASDREAMAAPFRERGLPEPLVEWLLMNLDRDGDRVKWRVDRRALESFHLGFRSADLWPSVQADPKRTRALLGGRSKYVSAADRARFESLGVPVEVVEGAGHFVHAERPDAVVDWLRSA